MYSDNQNNDIFEQIMEILSTQDQKRFKNILEILLNKIMLLERENALQAAPFERSPERKGYANGFKDRTLATGIGKLQLKVPKARGIQFYPKSLEKGSRSERALKLAIAEMYVKGVSTRKVAAITEELCGLNISSSQVSREAKILEEELVPFRNRPLGEFPYITLDALYVKVRHNGSVKNMAYLLAYGVNLEGKREILGSSIALSEAEVHWREFLLGLVRRGLNGVHLITSDDHPGLKGAIQAVLPTVEWQRCQFHMSSNAQAYAPKKHLKREIGQAMRDIFGCPDLDSARLVVSKTLDRFKEKAPEFAKWLDNNIEEGFTVYKFPSSHRRKLRTANGMERINREIRRREMVAVMFPNIDSAKRLIDGVLSEIHEEWITNTIYLNMDLLKEHEQTFSMHKIEGNYSMEEKRAI